MTRSVTVLERGRGVWGRALVVDLAARCSRFEALPVETRAMAIGGVGLGTVLLARHSGAGLDPMAGSVPVVFVTGPLAGTGLTTTAKFAVVTKSPLTGLLADSLSSSHFALSLKGCGVDALVLTGRCAEPTAIRVTEWGVELRSADDLRGLSGEEVEERLRAEWGESCRVAVAGPAAERGVRFATLSHDGRHAGRGGVGAAIWALGVKAVGVDGGRAAPVADRKAMERIRTRWARWSLGPGTRKYRVMGTTANLLVFNRLGILPTLNHSVPAGRAGYRGEALAGETLHTERRERRSSCAACTIGCTYHFRLRESAGDAVQAARIEYESLYALGPLCGVEDRDAVLHAASLCDRYGLDTISAGGTIAWAMECGEHGRLALPATAPDLRFGSGEALVHLVDRIGRREGIGDLLAEGSVRAARRLGGDAATLVTAVKGMELPGYDARAMPAMALGYAVGTRGACHNRSSAYEVDLSGAIDVDDSEALAAAVIEAEDRSALLDSLILCKFLRGALPDLWAECAEALRAATGEDVDAAELRRRAAAVIAVKRAYNRREGWSEERDTLPGRLLEGSRLGREAFERAKRVYHGFRNAESAMRNAESGMTADWARDERRRTTWRR